MKTRLAIAAILLVATASAAIAGQDAPVQDRMTAEEFKRAGLDKLDSNELRFLNAWLNDAHDELVARLDEENGDESIGFRPKEGPRKEIESAIDGPFTGWTGRTKFVLKNGQIWQQVGSGSYRFSGDSPEVIIRPRTMGSWKLYLKAGGRGVKVTRIK